jgi:hypothetical protein
MTFFGLLIDFPRRRYQGPLKDEHRVFWPFVRSIDEGTAANHFDEGELKKPIHS